MIRHLNPLSFKAFGTIFSERIPDAIAAPCGLESVVLNLQQRNVPIYRALSDTHLYSRTNTTVLSVSSDGKEFQHYYLDNAYIRELDGERILVVCNFNETTKIDLPGMDGKVLLSNYGRADGDESVFRPYEVAVYSL